MEPWEKIEIQIAYLEKHLTEQDKMIYQLQRQVTQQGKTIKILQDKIHSPDRGKNDAIDPDFTPPPHY